MNNKLKIFGGFKGLFLEARVGKDAKDSFVRQYGVHTGTNVSNANAFMVRENNGWPNATDLRMYFDAPQWVVDGLRKLGYRIVKRQIDMEKYEGGLRQYPWKVCNKDLFWRLVDYGYEVGKNACLEYDFVMMREVLKAYSQRRKQAVPALDINYIEADNPVYEAEMFAAVSA